jgi:hypothetical protein
MRKEGKDMNKKQLLDVAFSLKKLEDGIIALAGSLAGDERKADDTVNPEPDITLEQVRTVLADKSRSGKTGKVRELLLSFGVEKLSEIDPPRYAEMLKAAEAL